MLRNEDSHGILNIIILDKLEVLLLYNNIIVESIVSHCLHIITPIEVQ